MTQLTSHRFDILLPMLTQRQISPLIILYLAVFYDIVS